MAYPTHGPEYHERDSWKRPARVATTANITIATALNAGDSIDGVTLAAGDRVLVKEQTAPAENGIYVVGASPARAIDFASSAEIVGSAVVVTEGTTNGGKAWLCDTPAPITVGTDDITFATFGSGGGADPHITGTGTGYIDFPAGTETIRALMPGNVAGMQLEEAGYAMLFAGLVVNAYVYVAEVVAYLKNNAGQFKLDDSAGYVFVLGADGDAGDPGRTVELYGGWGDDGNSGPGILTLEGGKGDGTGGTSHLSGGDAESGANQDGGDVVLAGGAGDGTGRQGLVMISNLPTSDPGVSGALWNNAGTMKVSP